MVGNSCPLSARQNLRSSVPMDGGEWSYGAVAHEACKAEPKGESR